MERKSERSTMNETTNQSCAQPFCFYCAMAEPNRSLRRTRLAKCFKELPQRDSQEHVLVLSSLWKLAMSQPNNTEFSSLGLFSCLSKLINRGLSDKEWLMRDQNIYIPYYAAHIIGSYTINKPKAAVKAVESGVIPPLLGLLEGDLSWVESRVAVRALGHLASHKTTFKALIEYEQVIVNSAMKTASSCLEIVYGEFVSKKSADRLAYHCDLLTRGVGGAKLETRKAEEWASQLQCWSLALLERFARNERCLDSICNPSFLKELGGMWGGIANMSLPAGVGLIRTLCKTKGGRIAVADSKQAMESLCNKSRSSDDWQIMAIESLLLILKDQDSRYKAIDLAALCLSDLVEMRSVGGRSKAGEAITQILLQDYSKIKFGQLGLKSKRAQKALEEVWDLKVERRKREKLMSEDEIIEVKASSSKLKRQGNRLFWEGHVERAKVKYSEALVSCPLRYRKERIVLYSNRAQCCLLLKDSEGAIRDTTRALCLCSRRSLHGKSLWRRSQAYDMKGMAKESLMDCLLFLNVYGKSSEDAKHVGISRSVTRMINKQMNAAWIFSDVHHSCIRSRGDELVEQGMILYADFRVPLMDAKTSIRRKRRRFKPMRTRSEIVEASMMKVTQTRGP